MQKPDRLGSGRIRLMEAGKIILWWFDLPKIHEHRQRKNACFCEQRSYVGLRAFSPIG